MNRTEGPGQPADGDDLYNFEPHLEGWFDLDKATRYLSATQWDGHNHLSVITGSQWVDEILIRTAGGRWVINHDAERNNNGANTYRFATDNEARDWLIRSQDNDDAIAEHFGPLEDEAGPGRPEIGPAFSVRFPPELLTAVDSAAKAAGLTRAAWLRDTAAAMLFTRGAGEVQA